MLIIFFLPLTSYIFQLIHPIQKLSSRCPLYHGNSKKCRPFHFWRDHGIPQLCITTGRPAKTNAGSCSYRFVQGDLHNYLRDVILQIKPIKIYNITITNCDLSQHNRRFTSLIWRGLICKRGLSLCIQNSLALSLSIQ